MLLKIFLIIFCLFLPFAAQGASLIDINTASSEELEKIIGIGPALAQRIIETRPFNSLDDLIKVKGIGEIILQKIKDQELAWVYPQEELEPKPEPDPEPEQSPPEPEPKQELPEIGSPATEAVTYPTGVVFNEILPSPEGPDAENEWIEIFNQNDFDVDLSGWTIQDTTGSAKTYILNSKISALGYLVFLRPETKITLNNSSDGLNLFNPNGKIADSVNFGKASLGQSYNKIPTSPQRDPAMAGSGWAWSTNLTPGAKNIVPTPQTPKQKSEEKKSENGSPEANSLTEKGAAAVSTITESSGFSTLLIAFVIAIFSGIAFLTVKSNLKDFWH